MSENCSIIGCYSHRKSRGLCRRHYQICWRNGTLPTNWDKPEHHAKKTHEERLADKYIIAANGCWDWIGSISKLGYGCVAFWCDGRVRSEKAHRLAYQTWVGPITNGLCVLHKCDNRKCVNPDHLYLGTQAQNMRDMAERGGRKGIGVGDKNGRAKLTMKQARQIRDIYSTGGHSQESIGAKFGVSQFAVSAIVRNKRYVE